MKKKRIEASLSNVVMSSEQGKMIINGCITTIGEPSTGSPCGARGKLAVFTPESIEKCAQSFVGMPLNCTYPDGWFADGTDLFTGHGYVNIGYIREVHADGNKLMAEIVVWKDKFPDECYMILNGIDALGFSVEWYATKTHEDSEYIYMDEFEGAGCAILWQNCAAFSDTFIEKLAAARDKNRSDVEMTKEEMKAFAAEVAGIVNESVEARFKQLEEAQDEIKASVEAAKFDASVLDEVKASIAEVKASIADEVQKVAEMKSASAEVVAKVTENEPEIIEAGAENPVVDGATPQEVVAKPMEAEVPKEEGFVPPMPKTGQHVEANPLMASESKEDAIRKIEASNMTAIQKLTEITKLRMKKD